MIEVVASMGIFSVLVLAAMLAVADLSRRQQMAYHRMLAANIYMVIANYRASDMIQRAIANYSLGISGMDVASSGYTADKQAQFWGSWDYLHPKAMYHGQSWASIKAGAGNYIAESIPFDGGTWIDECPLFERFTAIKYGTDTSSYTNFTSPEPGMVVVAVKNNNVMATFDFVGGTSADQAVNRLFRLDTSAAGTVHGETYQDIVFSFSLSTPPPSGAAIKGSFLMMTFWSIAGMNYQVQTMTNTKTAGQNNARATFIGRYALLDGLKP